MKKVPFSAYGLWREIVLSADLCFCLAKLTEQIMIFGVVLLFFPLKPILLSTVWLMHNNRELLHSCYDMPLGGSVDGDCSFVSQLFRPE